MSHTATNDSPKYNPDAHADVCLLLEGTYPYVRGGVSTWVKQLIEGMQDLSFSIIGSVLFNNFSRRQSG